MSLLEVNNLSVDFSLRSGSVRAVDDLSFSIDAGECLGVVGESGCGKSTAAFAVMRLLAGNGSIANGSVIFDGRDLTKLSEAEMRHVRGNGIALIPQDPLTSLNPTTKIGKQIAEGLMIHKGASRETARERTLEVLEMVEMPSARERLQQYPFELSGGLRQRVIIAMGLVCEPKLLIADEPTTALDVTIQCQILDIFDKLRKELSMAVMLITHDMGVIASRTDRVAVMYAGQRVETSPTGPLFSNMRHPYSRALLDSVPSLDMKQGERLEAIPGSPPDLSRTLVGCRFAPRCELVTDECRTTAPTGQTQGESTFSCFHPVDGPHRTEVRIREQKAASTANTEQAIISVSNLTKVFDVGSVGRRKKLQAVSDVSFDVYRGETFGLVGESGCGKSTLARILVGIEESTSGEVLFEGSSIAGKVSRTSQIRRDRQMMFQDPYSSLDPRMKVGDIIQEPLAVQGVGTKESRFARAQELMTTVGLNPKMLDRHPHEFSGGQRQRIGLARALAVEPKLIIADEPVSALDVSVQAQILNMMLDLQQANNLTYVFISHDLAVVRYMADRLGVMYLGKLVETGPAEVVLSKPVHPYTQALLNAVPVPDPRRRGDQSVALQGELPSPLNPPSGCRFRTRCPYATDRCAAEEPQRTALDDSHWVACHFPLN